MSKRYGKIYGNHISTPSKKPRLDITITASQQADRDKKPPSTSKDVSDDDVWGADFNDEDIEEMDFVASQATTVSINDLGSDTASKPQPETLNQFSSRYTDPQPSTSRTNRNIDNFKSKKFEPKIPSKLGLSRKDSSRTKNAYDDRTNVATTSFGTQKPAPQSQMLSSSENQRTAITDDHSILFDDFKNNLLVVNGHNSTFQSQIINNHINGSNGPKAVPGTNDAIHISDDSILRELEKIKLENQMLRDNFITKEGETVFLRKQLQQTLSRAERDKIDKSQQIEEQATRHRTEINLFIKKEETLRTQLEFQSLQYNNIKEKCKLLESGSVKFTQPHTAHFDLVNKNRLNTTLNRPSPVKTVHVTETAVQTASFNLRNAYTLKKIIEIYPLSDIPQSIFEPSHIEPSVVEVQVIEKVGTKNLPILQDEENVRIFENPDLVKPIVTIINGQKLSVQFCLPDIAILMKKTEIELNSHNVLPLINKLVAVARELLLNTTLVLKRISEVIRNDDIRDMNDVYFSDFYKTYVNSTKSICDSNAWHDRERGIEARRSLAILSHIAHASNYLSEYLAGKITLNLFNDTNYEKYIKDMNSYDTWPKKGCKFEIMELLLEFVSTVGYVRRSHQFSGLIVSIIKLLISVKEKLINDEKGIDYVFKILKQIVFARPLFICYYHITELLMNFSKCVEFCNMLCVSTNQTTVSIWKDELHFTPDACIMQIYIAQLEFYQPDPVAIVDITYALVSFVLNTLSLMDIAWVNQAGSACKCSMNLFGLTLNFLHKCSKVNFDESVQKQNYNCVNSLKNPINEFHSSTETSQSIAQATKTCSKAICPNSEQLDKDTKIKSKNKQLLAIRKGIMFMCCLSNRDPDFIIRLSEIEDSFNLFTQQIESFGNLELNKTEKAALSSAKSKFFSDKVVSTEERSDKIQRCYGLEKHSKLTNRLSGSNRQEIVRSYENSASSNQWKSHHSSWFSEFMSKRKS